MNRLLMGTEVLILVACSVGGAYYASKNMFASLMVVGVLCTLIALALSLLRHKISPIQSLIRWILLVAAGVILILSSLVA